MEQIPGLGSSAIKASREFKAFAVGSGLGAVCHVNKIMVFIRGPYPSNILDSLACQRTTSKIISLNSSDENDLLIKVKYEQRRGCNAVA